MCCTSCIRDLATSGLVGGGGGDTGLLFGWVEIFALFKAILLLVDMADIGR